MGCRDLQYFTEDFQYGIQLRSAVRLVFQRNNFVVPILQFLNSFKTFYSVLKEYWRRRLKFKFVQMTHSYFFPNYVLLLEKFDLCNEIMKIIDYWFGFNLLSVASYYL